MMTHVLEEQDLLVVDAGCIDTYTLSHERDGEQLIVHLHGPHGSRRLHVTGLGDLPRAYARMVKSLREPLPATPTSTPPRATSETTPVDPDAIRIAPGAAVAAPAYAPHVDDPAAPLAIETTTDNTVPRKPGTLDVQLGVGAMADADSPHGLGI
jgi:hypothetical protein